MIDLSEARITTLAVHKVGNKAHAEGIVAAKDIFPLAEPLSMILQDFFLTAFKSDAFFRFTHETELSHNLVCTSCKQIFDQGREVFLDESVKLLQHLYNQSGHPNIKSGDFFVAHFRECQIDGQDLEAIGIFKAENKDLFLQVEEKEDEVGVKAEEGIPIKKLDKGCLVFNTFADEGFSVLMVDRSSEDAQYWKDDFLTVERLLDNSYQTEAFIGLARDFCEEVVAQEADPKEQMVFMNKSLNYFTQNKEFDLDGFKDKVIENSTQRENFETYRKDYEEQQGLTPAEEGFPISKYAVRNMRKQFKSLLKLDTHIQIRLDSKRIEEAGDFIERHWDDDREMYYYKVYFNEELE